MRRTIFAIILSVAILASAIRTPAWALTVEQIPNPRAVNSWVSDTADSISAARESRINQQIDRLKASTDTEVLVATVDRLEDEDSNLLDIDSYVRSLYERFGVGSAEGPEGIAGVGDCCFSGAKLKLLASMPNTSSGREIHANFLGGQLPLRWGFWPLLA